MLEGREVLCLALECDWGVAIGRGLGSGHFEAVLCVELIMLDAVGVGDHFGRAHRAGVELAGEALLRHTRAQGRVDSRRCAADEKPTSNSEPRRGNPFDSEVVRSADSSRG
jgi:hypothetical protein